MFSLPPGLGHDLVALSHPELRTSHQGHRSTLVLFNTDRHAGQRIFFLFIPCGP